MPFPLIPLILQLVIGVSLQIVGFLLAPKPKQARPDEVRDMESPTAEEGRPIPVVFGEHEVTGVNIIWFGDKHTRTREL